MRKQRKTAVFLAAVLILTGLTGCSGRMQSKSKEEQADRSVFVEGKEEVTSPVSERIFEKKAEIFLAAEVKIDGRGAELLEGQVISISEGGEYVFSGTLDEGMIYIDTKETVELTLNGVSIRHSDGPAILGQDSDAIYINVLEGTENELSDGDVYETNEEGKAIGKGTVFSNDDLYFIGEGTLVITGNYKHTVKSDDNIVVESGNLKLSAAKDGLNANDSLTVNGGMITVYRAEEGLEGEILTINDGEVMVSANDDCLNAGSQLLINGGTIYAVSGSGDAVDSNGSLEITGGFLTAYGSGMPEGGLDCDANKVKITGGTVIAAGGVNSTPDDTNTQYSVLLGAAEEGDAIGILDTEGHTVFACEIKVSFDQMLLSIPDIISGETYAVYTGGTISGTEERFGYFEGGVYEGGTKIQEFTADTMVISAGGSVGMQGFGNMPEIRKEPGGFGGGPDGTERPDEMPGSKERPKDGEQPPQLPENMPGDRQKNGEIPESGGQGV